MATEIIAPRLGVTVTEIRIVEWLVDDGATVSEGDPLVVVATDKVNHELPAPASGIVHQMAEIDDERPIGAALGEIV
jgi:pyruvate/2-oxoglutarate dehydrogenase complex dihydrolipoamide acyltransferase (E2) component